MGCFFENFKKLKTLFTTEDGHPVGTVQYWDKKPMKINEYKL